MSTTMSAHGTAADRATGVLSFVIPVRNDRASLLRCLAAIRRQPGGAAVRVVVADNGSIDGSGDAARQAGADVVHLPGLRVGALRNQAAARVTSGWIAFVDADHEIGEGWLAAACEWTDHADVGAVGAPYSSPPGATWVQRMYDAFRRHPGRAEDTEWLGAGNLIVRAELFAKLGGFDASLEACEDVEFCQRLRMAGHRLISDPRLASVHFGDPRSLRALFKSELWRGRNNIRVTVRGPLTWSALPSVITPIVDLSALTIAAIAAIAGRPAIVAVALGAVVAIAALRALRLWLRLDRKAWFDAPRAFAVALVYELARALALIARAPHRRAGAGAPVSAP